MTLLHQNVVWGFVGMIRQNIASQLDDWHLQFLTRCLQGAARRANLMKKSSDVESVGVAGGATNETPQTMHFRLGVRKAC